MNLAVLLGAIFVGWFLIAIVGSYLLDGFAYRRKKKEMRR